MKRLFFLSITMLTVSFAFANNGKSEPNEVQQGLINEVAKEQPQKVNANCEVTLPNGTVIRCTDCDCSDLYGLVILTKDIKKN